MGATVGVGWVSGGGTCANVVDEARMSEQATSGTDHRPKRIAKPQGSVTNYLPIRSMKATNGFEPFEGPLIRSRAPAQGDDDEGRTGYGLNGKLTVTAPHDGMVSGGMASGPVGHAMV
jgi:hypothetical protein